jgi:hypothetical protein
LVGLMYPRIRQREIVTVFPADFRRFWVDPRDTGRFAARALTGATNMGGQRIPLANEHLTDDEIVAKLEDTMQKRVGRKAGIYIQRVPRETAEKDKATDLRIASELNQMANAAHVDLEKVSSYGITLGTVHEFFEREHDTIRSLFDA